MKFEIDDKTGMIKELVLTDPNPNSYTVNLGHIGTEKAYKSLDIAKSKLINKQIQEIQDSKNVVHLKVNDSYTSQDVKQIQDYLSKIPVGTKISVVLNKNIRQIERNQKIVDEITKIYREKIPTLLGKESDLDEILEAIVYHSTGKDIKDL